MSVELKSIQEAALECQDYAVRMRRAFHEYPELSGREYYRLALTNKEVRIMFENMVRDWFSERRGSYNEFLEALLADDMDAMNEYMN